MRRRSSSPRSLRPSSAFSDPAAHSPVKTPGPAAPAATCSRPPDLRFPSLAFLHYGGSVIDRYTRPQMGRIWSEESKYQAWLRVELAVCEAYARRGRIPVDAMTRIRDTARVDIA